MDLELTEVQRKISYALLAPLWAVIIYNYMMPLEQNGLQVFLYWSGVVMSVIHAAEIFIFYPRLPKTTNKLLGIVLIFFFGIVYGSSLPKN